MECLICQAVPSQKNPFGLLSCGHSFCNDCLETQLATNEAKCSVCQSSFQTIPSQCLVYLPTRCHETNCSSCHDNHPATQRCLNCSECFCDFRAKTHHCQDPPRNPILVSIDETLPAVKKMSRCRLNYLQFKFCPKHNRPFEFLSLDSRTCNELLCSDCPRGDDSSIRLIRLGESTSVSLIGEKLKHIHELGCKGKQHLAELREEEVWLSSRLSELERSKEQALGEIRRVFSSLREALDVREQALEQEVEKLNKSLSFSLDEERERSRVWQGQLSLLGECVEEMEAWVRSVSSSESSTDSVDRSHCLTLDSDKALMVDVCLLEDALRNSLSSSQTSCFLRSSISSSSEGVRSEYEQSERVSQLRDRINFSFSPQHLSSSGFPSQFSFNTDFDSDPSDSSSTLSIVNFFSGLGCLSCSSSVPLPPVSSPFDWSRGPPQHILSFYSEGNGLNQVRLPYSLAYSPVSKLYFVADCDNSRIQVFRNNPQAEREGQLEIEYLPPSYDADPISRMVLYSTQFGLKNPTCVHYHEGTLFICESAEHRVHVCREKIGTVAFNFGTFGGRYGQFNELDSCTVYGNHLFVSDQDNNRIQKFSLSDLSHVLTFGDGKDNPMYPSQLTVFNCKLYVADGCKNRILVFDPDSGRELHVIGPSLSNGETLSGPSGLLVSHNLLFVSSNHRISVFDVNDQCLYSFGSEGSGDGQFSDPNGLLMVEDRLFVCDRENNRIQVFGQH